MKHEELKELLPLYIDGGLDRDETERVEAHLAECEECRQELVHYQENFDFLSSIDDVEVSSDFLVSVLKRIEAEKQSVTGETMKHRIDAQSGSSWWERLKDLLSWRLRIPVGAMGAAAVALVVFLLIGPWSGIHDGGGVKDEGAKNYNLRNEVQYEMYDRMSVPSEPAPIQQKMQFSAPKTGAAELQMDQLSTEMERKIIKTASLRVEVKDTKAAEKQIMNIANDLQGFIAHSNSWVTGGNQRYTSYQLRIPADGFYDALERVETLGEVKNRQLGGQDVTEEYIDIQSRLKNLQLQEERYRELLIKAVDVEDMLAIERELERIRGSIESLQGRMNYLDNRINMSTIDVELAEPQPITPSNNWGLLDVLRDAVREMLNTFYNMIVRFGRILPYLLLLVVAFLIYRGVRRKKK